MDEIPRRVFLGTIKWIQLFSDHLVITFHRDPDLNRKIFYKDITGIRFIKGSLFGLALGRISIERLGEKGFLNSLSLNSIEFKKKQNREATELKNEIEELSIQARRAQASAYTRFSDDK